MARPTRTRLSALSALWRALRSSGGSGEPSTTDRLRAVPRLVAATLTGRYDGMTRGRLGLLLLALLYVVSPVDLVPELALSLIGLGDDALVLAWLAGSVLAETDDFLRWEAARGRGPSVVPGQVVR